MEEALLHLLLTNAGISMLAGDRVNWSSRPGDIALPALALHRIGGRHDGTLTGRSGLVDSKVQINCWGRSFREAKLLSRAVVRALPHAPLAANDVVIQGVFIDRESDSFEGDNPVPLYCSRIDLSVWHKENQSGH